MYVIVFCGYEGIDDVLWAGSSRDEAIAKIKEASNKITRLSKIYHKYGEYKDYDDEEDGLWRRPYDIAEKWGRPWDNLCIMGHQDDIKGLCVMKLQGEWGFRCCCKELGFETEGWLY